MTENRIMGLSVGSDVELVEAVGWGKRTSALMARSKVALALLTLRQGGEMNQSELAASIDGFSGQARALSLHLEEAGLIRIREVPWAGRASYRLMLTPKGENVADAVEALTTAFEGHPPEGDSERQSIAALRDIATRAAHEPR